MEKAVPTLTLLTVRCGRVHTRAEDLNCTSRFGSGVPGIGALCELRKCQERGARYAAGIYEVNLTYLPDWEPPSMYYRPLESRTCSRRCQADFVWYRQRQRNSCARELDQMLRVSDVEPCQNQS